MGLILRAFSVRGKGQENYVLLAMIFNPAKYPCLEHNLCAGSLASSSVVPYFFHESSLLKDIINWREILLLTQHAAINLTIKSIINPSRQRSFRNMFPYAQFVFIIRAWRLLLVWINKGKRQGGYSYLWAKKHLDHKRRYSTFNKTNILLKVYLGFIFSL